MPRIAIIGAGVAGLRLGLFLRRNGVDVTIYTDRGPDRLWASMASPEGTERFLASLA